MFQPLDRVQLLVDWPDRDHKLIVAVAVRVGSSELVRPLLLDCASEFCVITREFAGRAGWSDPGDLMVQRISTRLGTYSGVVDRIDVTFPGIGGEHLTIDATWLIIEDWPGPTVLGWRGGLEWMCFALEPLDCWFYFAAA